MKYGNLTKMNLLNRISSNKGSAESLVAKMTHTFSREQRGEGLQTISPSIRQKLSLELTTV